MMDYGIVYNECNSEKHEGNLRFCGIEENESLVFYDNVNGEKRTLIYIKKDRIYKKRIIPRNVVNIRMDKNGDLYYLCENPPRIIVERGGNKDSLVLSDVAEPTFINVSDSYIFVSNAASEVFVYEKSCLNYLFCMDLSRANVKEPIYIDSYKENSFVVTDSKNHSVKVIDSNLNILWQYGIDGFPGEKYNELYTPTYAFKYQGCIAIAEQRTHRVLIVSKDKQIVKQFGVANYIGMMGDYLWAPQIAQLNEWIYLIMCKGGTVYAQKYNLYSDKYEHVYGQPLIRFSQLNLPRSCDYCGRNHYLLVSDTYHNRVVVFDINGDEVLDIKTTTMGELSWPRCAKWDDEEHIYVVDSRKRRILYLTLDGNVERYFIIPNDVATGEWPQSIDFYSDKMLIAFQTQVAVFDKETHKVIYCTDEAHLAMKDVHFACYSNEGELVIADTGNDRLIVIHDGSIQSVEKLNNGGEYIKLKRPRCVCIYMNCYYIVNSGDSKIYICDKFTLNVIGIYGENRGLDTDRMSLPRWITHCYGSYFAISDSDNNRVIIRDFSNYNV